MVEYYIYDFKFENKHFSICVMSKGHVHIYYEEVALVKIASYSGFYSANELPIIKKHTNRYDF